MPEKPNREAFEKQCEEISNKLDNLLDWEMKFYLYCLIPRYAEKLTAEMREHELKKSDDVLIMDGLRRTVKQLLVVVGMLTTELF